MATDVFFGKEQFMHLVGVKSSRYTAEEFYDACILKTIQPEDCSPSHRNYVNRDAKVYTFREQFHFSNAKIYRIGSNDASSLYNDFCIATGNASGMIGYDSRHRKHQELIPVTLLNKSLFEHCKKPERILAVIVRDSCENEFVLYECISGFYAKIKEEL